MILFAFLLKSLLAVMWSETPVSYNKTVLRPTYVGLGVDLDIAAAPAPGK